MEVLGKERRFKLTIGAAAEIADFCPEGDIGRIGELLGSGSTAKSLRASAKLIAALNRGYEEAENPRAEHPDCLTVRDVLSLDADVFGELLQEAVKAFAEDQKPKTEIRSKNASGDA